MQEGGFMSLNIRDFIYLDVDRLKSIISQVDEGLVNLSEEVKSTTDEVDSSVEAGVLSILKGFVGAKYISQNQDTNTKSFHDFIYNKVESALTEADLLTHIPEKDTGSDITNESVRDSLNNTAFVLAKGKVVINDFNNMNIFLEKFNTVIDFLAHCTSLTLPEDTSPHKKKQAKNEVKESKMDKKMIDGFQMFFDTFYKDRVVIKMLPFENKTEFILVGNLNEKYLRDDISSITYKYGTAPISEWTIFCQVASIPPKERKVPQITTGSEIESGIQGVFDAYRTIESLAQSVVYPEIAITPIAIYRE